MDVLKENKKVVLLGNEAIARGALEAGLKFASAYPGTPSSEIGMTLAKIANKIGIYFEFSTNEKVAFETAAGASLSGLPSLVCMKHFGFNVASDSVYPIVYVGVDAPLVIVVADDPECFGSAQSEQDSRGYARIANLPMLEPSNPQEAFELTKIAFEISGKYGIPVLVRTTTKVNHSIGTVKVGKIVRGKKKAFFKKNIERFYNIRPNLNIMHKKVLEKLEKIKKGYSRLNKIIGDGKYGIICSGAVCDFVLETINSLEENVGVLKLNLTYPLDREIIAKFIKNKLQVLVLEELEPWVENFVGSVAKEVNPKLKIYGKDILPRVGQYTFDIVYDSILKFVGKNVKKEKVKINLKIPKRKPTFCQGCPHRSTFYAVKNSVPEDTIFAGDIGCYMLGIYKPYEMQDFIICMGASEGIAHGINKSSSQRPVVFIGDSTFFHAGMPALLNMKYNKSNPLVIVLDNRITAMTGHQPCPSTGKTATGKESEEIYPEEIAKSFKIKNVEVVNAFNQREIREKVRRLYEKKELGVIVSRGECRLLAMKKLKREGKQPTKFQIDQNLCQKCGTCTNKFSCPAIERKFENGKYVYSINQDLCWGCSVCSQICPYKAIKPSKLIKK